MPWYAHIIAVHNTSVGPGTHVGSQQTITVIWCYCWITTLCSKGHCIKFTQIKLPRSTIHRQTQNLINIHLSLSMFITRAQYQQLSIDINYIKLMFDCEKKYDKPVWAGTPPFVNLALMSAACLSRAWPFTFSASSSLAFSRPWYLSICWSSSCFSYRNTEMLATGSMPPSAAVGDVAEMPAPAACLGYNCICLLKHSTTKDAC